MREPALALSNYRTLVALDERFTPLAPPADPGRGDRLVRDALRALAAGPAVTGLGVDPGS